MQQRLQSLDVFRGMTVFFMIIVNSSGNWSTTYAPLLHAQWHGFTPTDLVFPSFLFAVGASLAIVMARWKTEKTNSEVHRKILTRTAIIFLLGFLMYWFPFTDWKDGALTFRPIGETRIMGVLQRIALAYGLSALLLYHFSLRNVIYITLGILVGYWLILLSFGDLTMSGNAGHLLDMFLLGENHLYGGEGVPFDPEGLLSTLPCIGNVVAGYATVYWLRQKPKDLEVRLCLALIGAGLIAVAFLWNYGFPINKKLWTSSYVLLTSGIAMLMLVALHYLLDWRKKEYASLNFFTPMGKNPLFIYLLSEVGVIILYWIPNAANGTLYNALYHNIFSKVGAYFGAFLFALTWTLICWSVAVWMDRRKWYVRV
ncbi:MAG: heparan-alpha-glucosaminide N-acetyltransferase domain-containing protein [Chitinophagales bacterium]